MRCPQRVSAVVVIFSTLVSPLASLACTGITIKPKDGSVIYARTLEFAINTQSNIIIVPRGQQYVGSTPQGKPGIQWETKYAFVGANGFNLPVVLDGVNEKGLAVGLFYFPGYADYQNITFECMNRCLAPWELGTYLLGHCSTIDEARLAAGHVRVGPVVQPDMGIVPPVHYIVTDSTGASIVIEYVNEALKIHKNPLGVVTNSPTFDWHMINLGNYVNLSVTNVPQITIGGQEIKDLGQGSGMLGLPGDFTPPSRFVRAVAFAKNALPVNTAQEGILQTFHILNQFDIPKGAARGTEDGHVVADYTLWTAASDLQNLRYFFRTFENSKIRMIDLKACDLNAAKVLTISMAGNEVIEDITSQAK